MQIREALTFDDVVVVPGFSETLPDAADTTATFAAGITLAVPLVSAAMDKVTECGMAIAMARHGGYELFVAGEGMVIELP